MNIWIVEASEPLPLTDGTFRDFRCGLLAKALVREGHQVVWWSSTFNHEKKRQRFHESRTIDTDSGFRLRLLYGPGYQRNTSPQRLLHNHWVANAFFREAMAMPDRPDMLFCCLPTLELAEKSVTFGQYIGVPVLIDVRDHWPDHYLSMVPPIFQRPFRILLTAEFRRVRSILRNATAISAISQTQLDWALGHAERQQQPTDGVFPIGYPLQNNLSETQLSERRDQLVRQYQLTEKRLVVTFVGSFVSSYAFETVIAAAKILQDTGRTDITFIFVGDGDRGKQLRSLAADLQNVLFTGWFDQLAITAILQCSSVGLAPYYSDAVMSLPNKPFEYMASGLPILSSSCGELGQLILQERIGMLYQADDPMSLVTCVCELADYPAKRQLMGQNARKLIERRFAAESVYPQLIAHMQTLIHTQSTHTKASSLMPPNRARPSLWTNSTIDLPKRMFDLLFASGGLVVLSPLLFVIALMIKLSSPGPIFYKGTRVGKGGKLFQMYKFRTMVINADTIGGSSTPDDDPRITPVGRWLRRHKLDELPQLINVFKGEMSFVGPRPQVKWAVDLYTPEQRLVLTVLPGITDYASLNFPNEGEILKGSSDPDKDYMEKIHPEKMRLSIEYVRNRSFWLDVSLILQTIKTIVK